MVRAGDRYLRGKQVRLISSTNEQLGIVSVDEALRLAREAGEDLVEVAPTATPPVCRIMDYGKFQYEQSKRQRDQKKKHHVQKLKEVKFHPNIDPHDYTTKVNRAIAFFEKGFKVKFSIYFRGREMAHTELGMELMARVIQDIEGIATVESQPRRSGRMITMLLGPGGKKSH